MQHFFHWQYHDSARFLGQDIHSLLLCPDPSRRLERSYASPKPLGQGGWEMSRGGHGIRCHNGFWRINIPNFNGKHRDTMGHSCFFFFWGGACYKPKSIKQTIFFETWENTGASFVLSKAQLVSLLVTGWIYTVWFQRCFVFNPKFAEMIHLGKWVATTIYLEDHPN